MRLYTSPILKILVQDKPQNYRTLPNQNPVNPFNPENPGSRQRLHQKTGAIFNDTFVCKIAVRLQDTPAPPQGEAGTPPKARDTSGIASRDHFFPSRKNGNHRIRG